MRDPQPFGGERTTTVDRGCGALRPFGGPPGAEGLGELEDPERSKQHVIRTLLRIRGFGDPSGGRRQEYDPDVGASRARLPHERVHAAFRKVHIDDDVRRVALSYQLERMRLAFGFPLDPEVVESQEAPEQQSSRLFASDHHRAGPRGIGRGRLGCVSSIGRRHGSMGRETLGPSDTSNLCRPDLTPGPVTCGFARWGGQVAEERSGSQ
jgi:hypothetical protein